MKIDLNDILDNIYGGVYYVDQNRKIKYWNKEAEEITGFSKKKLSVNTVMTIFFSM